MAAQDLKLGRAWDDTFNNWTDDLQLGKKFKKPAQARAGSSVWTGSPKQARVAAYYPGKGSKADVRGRLLGIAKRTRQVMVKITPGKNRTMSSVRNHLVYIAREGEEKLQDQDGREFNGVDEVKEVAWAWQHTGPQMAEHAEHKQAFNIMFSMPEGTDERALYEAVRKTAEIEFEGHQWVMAQHFDQPQVHCHICVKAESIDGQRLNPRKADLQRWRERFAHELRERGVEAEATRRGARMQREKVNKPWAVTRLQERGEQTSPAPSEPNALRAAKWAATEEKASASYSKIIAALGASNDPADRSLAEELQKTLKSVPKTKDQDHKPDTKKDQDRG